MTVVMSRHDNSPRIHESLGDQSFYVCCLKCGQGTEALLLSDTTLRDALMENVLQVQQGTTRFNENMEALKGNFLFRRYFRKLDNQRSKGVKNKEKKINQNMIQTRSPIESKRKCQSSVLPGLTIT
jgi:hypothetical protein